MVFIFSSIIHASDDYSECITDVYFGNGVWNTYKQAKKGRTQIQRRLLKKGMIKHEEIMHDGQSSLGKKYAFKIAYNWHGMYRNDSTHDEQFKMFFDIAETFVQMKEAGQVGSSSIFKFLEWFVVDQGYPAEFKQQVQAYIDLATVTHMSNVLEMVADYQQYSFDKGHRVLLISHSQGNLWANDMVKAFKPWQREYFRNVGVAVPADHLEAESRYVTLSCDKVMGIIPGHMSWNKKCYGVEEISGHEFMRSYLRNDNSEKEIFRDAEFYIKILGALDSQWITDQEFDKNTCDYKITVKHQYDPSIEMAEKVYPFNTSKKLYQVNGEYVKASCGGKNILETWDGKKDNECLMIDNVEEEKIEEDINETVLPYTSVEFILLRRYYSSNFFADCFPLVDAKIAIVGDNKIIKIINNPTKIPGENELSEFLSNGYGNLYKMYNESIFYRTGILSDLKLSINTIWNMTVPKYTGWSGVGATQCPLDKEVISYQFTQEDLNLILKK